MAQLIGSAIGMNVSSKILQIQSLIPNRFMLAADLYISIITHQVVVDKIRAF